MVGGNVFDPLRKLESGVGRDGHHYTGEDVVVGRVLNEEIDHKIVRCTCGTEFKTNLLKGYATCPKGHKVMGPRMKELIGTS
jgi:hypothetical protein